MKSQKRKISTIMIVLLSVVMLSAVNVSALYYTEDFEDDTVGADPSSGQYTYTEDVPKTMIANVSNDTTWGSGSNANSFLFNATNGLGDTCDFNYSVGDADNSFTFKFNLTEWHEDLDISLKGNASREIAHLNLTELGGYICAQATAGAALTPLWNASVSPGTWYQVTFRFNYTTSMCNASLWNLSTGTAVLLSAATNNWGAWGLNNSGFANFNITGVTGKKADVYFDDLVSHGTYVAALDPNNLGTQLSGLLSVVVYLMFILGLVGLVMAAFTKFKF